MTNVLTVHGGGNAGKSTVIEVLALMGTFGFLWSSIQAAAFEGKHLRTMTWTPEVSSLPKTPPPLSMPLSGSV